MTSSQAVDQPTDQPRSASEQPTDTAPAQGFWATLGGLPSEVRLVLGGFLLATLGLGLTTSFLMVYLSQARGIGTATVGLVLSAVGLVGFAFSPVGGTLIDRWGAPRAMVVGLVMLASGALGLSLVTQWWEALLVLAVWACGMSLLNPGLTSLLTVAVPVQQREAVYGLQFMTMNLGIGVGSLTAAAGLADSSVGSFQWLYRGEAVAYLVFMGIVLVSASRLAPPAPAAGPAEGPAEGAAAGAAAGPAGEQLPGTPSASATDDPPAGTGGWREVLADRDVVVIAAVATVILVFGYAQVETGLTTWTTTRVDLVPRALGLILAVNTATIVLFQPIALRIAADRRRTHVLALTCVLWSACWVLVGLAAHTPRTMALVLLCAAMFLFAVGETFWAPTLPAIINALAPDALRGRYNAMGSFAWTAATVAGPAFAGITLGNHWDAAWLIAIVAAPLVGLVALLGVGRLLPDHANSPSRAG